MGPAPGMQFRRRAEDGVVDVIVCLADFLVPPFTIPVPTTTPAGTPAVASCLPLLFHLHPHPPRLRVAVEYFFYTSNLTGSLLCLEPSMAPNCPQWEEQTPCGSQLFQPLSWLLPLPPSALLPPALLAHGGFTCAVPSAWDPFTCPAFHLTKASSFRRTQHPSPFLEKALLNSTPPTPWL